MSQSSSWLTAYSNAHNIIIAVGRGNNGAVMVSQTVAIPKNIISTTMEYFVSGGGTASYFFQIGLTSLREPASTEIAIRSGGTEMTSKTVTYFYD